MKAGLLLTGSGAMIYLTSHSDYIDAALIEKLKAKGIGKFIAFQVPVELARSRYGSHFDIVAEELNESGDLRILDYDGSRAFKMFSMKEMGDPFFYE